RQVPGRPASTSVSPSSSSMSQQLTFACWMRWTPSATSVRNMDNLLSCVSMRCPRCYPCKGMHVGGWASTSSLEGARGQQAGARDGLAGVVAQGGGPVIGIHVDDIGLVGAGLGIRGLEVAHDDDQITRIDQVGGGTIDADAAGSGITGDHIGLNPGAVGDVHDGDLLTLDEASGADQVGVDGDGTDIVEVGLGDGGAVNLATEDGAQHVGVLKYGCVAVTTPPVHGLRGSRMGEWCR